MGNSVYSILRKKYPESEYALMQEVSDKAGFGRSRSADFILMNLWPSRGLSLNGIELKSSRSDWLSEKRNPKKAENIFQYCDFFWLLTNGDDIVKIEEIPDNWGWMEIKGQGIRIKKQAPKLEPKEISRNFLASMLKRACDKGGFIRESEIKSEIDKVRERTKQLSEQTNERNNKLYQEIKTKLEDYKKETGIDLTQPDWISTATNIGKAVKFVQNGGIENIKKQLLGLESTAKIVLDRITNGLADLDGEL